jgi:hypothetical protein
VSEKVDRYTRELRARKGTTFTDLEFFAEHAIAELEAETNRLAHEVSRQVAYREMEQRINGSLKSELQDRIDKLNAGHTAQIEAIVQTRDHVEAELAALKASHAVEVTGILRSVMGYMTALTASGADMVTFVAQKMEPYRDTADAAREDGES